jgi:hypothetical protein
VPWPVLAGCFAGALGTEAGLLLSPEAGVPAGLLLGLRVALGAWIVATLADAGWAMIKTTEGTPGPGAGSATSTAFEGRGGQIGAAAAAGGHLPLTAARSRIARWWAAFPAGFVLLGAVVVLTALLLRAPGRLAVTLLGFGLTALPLALVVQRHAGPGPARGVAGALAVFAVVAGAGDVRQAPPIEAYREESTIRWAVGWPAEGWVLRHEIRLDRPLDASPLSLLVPLARPYSGRSQLFVSLNGHPLGAAQGTNQWTVRVPVPGELAAGETRLTFDLEARPPDPALRIMAHRWTGGATLGADASSYFDTVRWRPGTFNDAMGRPQGGIYVLRLEPAPAGEAG